MIRVFGIWRHVVCQTVTNISEETAACILTFISWWWRRQFSPKRWCLPIRFLDVIGRVAVVLRRLEFGRYQLRFSAETRAILTEDFMVFLAPYIHAGTISEFGHDRFLPNVSNSWCRPAIPCYIVQTPIESYSNPLPLNPRQYTAPHPIETAIWICHTIT